MKVDGAAFVAQTGSEPEGFGAWTFGVKTFFKGKRRYFEIVKHGQYREALAAVKRDVKAMQQINGTTIVVVSKE